MVFYFSPSGHVEGGNDWLIYMGKDKFENEELIKYGLPEDVWCASPAHEACQPLSLQHDHAPVRAPDSASTAQTRTLGTAAGCCGGICACMRAAARLCSHLTARWLRFMSQIMQHALLHHFMCDTGRRTQRLSTQSSADADSCEAFALGRARTAAGGENASDDDKHT